MQQAVAITRGIKFGHPVTHSSSRSPNSVPTDVMACKQIPLRKDGTRHGTRHGTLAWTLSLELGLGQGLGNWVGIGKGVWLGVNTILKRQQTMSAAVNALRKFE